MTAYDAIEHLFHTRNDLVHEIGTGLVAHFSLRDIWDPEEAVRLGRITLDAIRLMESVITRTTPTHFPNRIAEDGSPEDEVEKLIVEINKVENEITARINEDDWLNGKGWRESLDAHRAALKFEISFLDDADFLRPVRHLDLTRPAKIGYLRNRRDYLRTLLVELDKTIGSESTAQPPSDGNTAT